MFGARHVCWQCHRRIVAAQGRVLTSSTPPSLSITTTRRAFHAAPAVCSIVQSPQPSPSPSSPPLLDPSLPLREQLRKWQEINGGPTHDELDIFENYPRADLEETTNNLTRANNHGSKSDESIEDKQWDEDPDLDRDPDLVTLGVFLNPGDVVEISVAGREPTLAVFVQQLGEDSQFLSTNGRWCHCTLAAITFAIPGCIDPALLEPIRPFMPTQPSQLHLQSAIHLPRELSSPVTTLLRQLTNESERVYRENASVLDHAHATLADDTRTRMMTLEQIARALIGHNDEAWKPSSEVLLAVRKSLLHNVFRFRTDPRSHRLTNLFSIRPKVDVDNVETVMGWVRDYQTCVASSATRSAQHGVDFSNQTDGSRHVRRFVEKARRLVARSREHRDIAWGFVGPSKSRPDAMHTVWGEAFSDSDRAIINFLQYRALTKAYSSKPELHSACVAIIRATKCYDGVSSKSGRYFDTAISRATALIFLQEIGVLSPYENRTLYDEHLVLPKVRASRNVDLLNTKAELMQKKPDFRDRMQHLRKDWGSVNVYCVDSAGAKDIDDGVSISRVEGKESEFWVHVHVANPTAFFDKTHVLSGLAAHMTETVYTPEHVFLMLPEWATQNYFSLASRRPTLTFSARVDQNGEILENKIQSGIIGNVIRLTPTALATHLGSAPEDDEVHFIVGGKAPTPTHSTAPVKLTPDQLQELRDLQTVGSRLFERRMSAGAAIQLDKATHARVFDGESNLSWAAPSTDRARLIVGDPTIWLTANSADIVAATSFGPKIIVQEMMILGCRVAASWCSERGIPAIFRGTVQSPTISSKNSLSLEEFKTRVWTPYLEAHGRPSLFLVLQYNMMVGRSISHHSSLPHKSLGSEEGYIKVTSPLRRFCDMMAHWQIEAALRYEAESGTKLNAQTLADSSHSILPFSRRQMQDAVTTLTPREKLILKAKVYSQSFWICQAIARAFYYKEAPLPETFTVLVRYLYHSFNRPAFGALKELSLRVRILNPDNLDLRIGDEWEMKIDSVNTYFRTITVTPIRLLVREPTFEGVALM
ncbi:RNB-domain-containing protein [Polyplosphaeria fusca]|uniref:RNB-domain-containing protein n=1 Tax=Polyplosphaeria fusca TaxID=682080 RepID=A0A9P4QHN9_9PLEO|nr:RNB-domain-containing protein [Polyplosphaeria fusca]